VELYYGDYRPVDGVLIAHSYEARVENQVVQITNIEKVEINPLIDDDIFKMPLRAESRPDRRSSDSSPVMAAGNSSRAPGRKRGLR
jgi:hypothetical protein